MGGEEGGCSAVHEGAMVGSVVVVVDEPGVGFGAELGAQHRLGRPEAPWPKRSKNLWL